MSSCLSHKAAGQPLKSLSMDGSKSQSTDSGVCTSARQPPRPARLSVLKYMWLSSLSRRRAARRATRGSPRWASPQRGTRQRGSLPLPSTRCQPKRNLFSMKAMRELSTSLTFGAPLSVPPHRWHGKMSIQKTRSRNPSDCSWHAVPRASESDPAVPV